MRAISLWQPWATLIAIGAKSIETRSWPAGYTGPLAIHASQRVVPWEHPAFDTALDAAGYWNPRQLPTGAIVAVCELKDCVRIVSSLATLANGAAVRPPEWHFGDYSPGRYAWILSNVRRLAKPIPCRGRQRFFNVPDEALQLA